MKTLKKCYEGIHFAIASIDKLALLGMITVISADVIKRQFGSGILWAQEVATIFFVWFTFLSMVEGVKHRLHISITIVFDRLPAKIQKIVSYFSDASMCLVGILMCYFGTGLCNTATRSLAATGWSAKVVYIIIPIAGLMIAVDSAVFIAKRIMNIEEVLEGEEV